MAVSGLGEKVIAEKIVRDSTRKVQNSTVKVLTYILENTEPLSNIFISSTASMMKNLSLQRSTIEAAFAILEQSKVVVKLNNNTWKVSEDAYTKPPAAVSGITSGGILGDWTKMCLGHFAGSDTTRSGYENILFNHIIPALGRIPLDELTADDIEKYINDKLAEGFSECTVAKHYALLKRMLRLAVEDKRMAVNPMDAVAPPKVTAQPLSVYTKAQIKKMINKSKGMILHIVILLAFFLGLSRSEICGLRWEEDIDFEHDMLQINRERTTIKGKAIEKDLDTAEAKRALFTPEIVKNALIALKAEQEIIAAANPSYTLSGYVVTNKDGLPENPDNISEMMGKFLDENGLPRYGLKGLRASFGVQAIENKIYPVELTKILGLSKTSRTIDRFSSCVKSNGSSALKTIAGKYV